MPLRVALQLCTLAGRGPLLIHALLVLVQGLLPLAGLFAMQWLVDAVADGVAGRTLAADAWRQASLAVAVAAAVAFVGNALRASAAVFTETHGRRLADACTARFQEHAARLDLAAFDRPAFHDLLHRAGGEAASRPVRLVQDFAAFGTATVSLLAMALVLATVEPWLPLVVATAAAPIAWTRQRHARLRFAWQQEATAAQREIGYLGATLTGRATAKDVRGLGLLPMVQHRLAGLRAGLRQAQQRLARARARDDLLVHTLAGAALFGAYLHLGNLALAGVLSIGGLVLHAQAVQRAQNGVRDLLGAGSAIVESRLFLRPLVDFLAAVPAVRAEPPAVDLAPGSLALATTSLGFTYPGATVAALHDVTVRIAPGERIAVVGQNGSGKSTFVKLLCRLYDPTTGRLLANDVDVRHVQPEHYRARLACLFQDAHAFELTIGENLRLGHREPADDAVLWRSLTIVGLADRVRALPLGLATPLSRRAKDGVEWSGGELRRLLLARALAQPADVLLLDEPFGALDGEAATALAAALVAEDRRRTLVLVDHRSAAIRCVDRVLLFERGQLIADGPPATLAATEPRFASLFPDW